MLRRRLDELTNSFVSEHGDLALERLDVSETDLQTLMDAVQSLPFLSQRKMVVLREPSANKEVAENIEQIISSVPETTDLIIYEPDPDKRTSYFKNLQKGTKLEQFGELDGTKLARWIIEETKAYNGVVSLADANYLIERIGQNQQLLANELRKLVLYDPNISRKTINLLTEPTSQGKVFELLEAAFGGRKQKALKLYEEQREQKVEAQAIMAMLAWQLNLITLVKLGKGKGASEIAIDAGMKTFPINKAAGLAARITNKRLNALIGELLQIDYQSKTSSIDLDEALKTYISLM